MTLSQNDDKDGFDVAGTAPQRIVKLFENQDRRFETRQQGFDLLRVATDLPDIAAGELNLFYGKEFRKKLAFLEDFNLVVDATYTEILKPDPRAFGFITDGLAIAAKDCVFVDDQLKNIRGGEAVGMACVHFDVTNPGKSYAHALSLLSA